MAVLVYSLNQRGLLRQERRQAKLARINSQLRELYGPLNALVDVNERLWEALRATRLPAQDERHAGGGSEEWHRWRDLALMPANRDMRDLILRHADLLVEDHAPRALRDFCAHVAALEVALAGYPSGVREKALIEHPGAAYVDYVREAFASLKGQQQQLLRAIDHSAPSSRLVP